MWAGARDADHWDLLDVRRNLGGAVTVCVYAPSLQCALRRDLTKQSGYVHMTRVGDSMPLACGCAARVSGLRLASRHSVRLRRAGAGMKMNLNLNE